MSNIKVVFMRHGESEWNQLNQFTGWQDISLSKKGKQEALNAGKILKKNGFHFDQAYTSVLNRSINTLWCVLKVLRTLWVPVKKSWQLNERHYGALEGLNKKKVVIEYGAEQIKLWRRSFVHTPPHLEKKDSRYPGFDRRYSKIDKKNIPTSESLKDTSKRVIAYWNNVIIPKIKNNNKVIVIAHGNSLRALIKYLNNINQNDIIKLNISTGTPIVYEFSDNLKPLKYSYLQ